MRVPRLVLSLMSVGSLLLAAGCTVGPEPARPQTVADEAEAFVHADQAMASAQLELQPWWLHFADQTTVELVQTALEHNTELRVAAANVLEAEASLRAVQASRWPSLDYSAAATRSETAFNLPAQGLIKVRANNYSAELGMSYQVDLFGRLKRSRQAAWASLLAERAAAETVLHSVVAATVRARVQVATVERSLQIARELTASWQRTLESVERRYRSGLAEPMELYLARENYGAVQAAAAQLEGLLAQSRHALEVLVGRRPGTGPELPDTLPELPDLAPVPAGLPLALLDRRPDLRGSELRLAAASYGVGVAVADLYPRLSLSASYGARSERVSDLFDLDSAVYQLLANLVGPLFSGGARRAEVAAAEARLEAAAASYAGAVLNALREVEDALAGDAANRERLLYAQRRLADARGADRLARDRYGRGVASLLTVLETERRMRAAEEALMTTKADVWNTRINLFLALGGDWSPVQPATEELPVAAGVAGDAATIPAATAEGEVS